ncbi:chemotaxis protein CheW [Devosia beringensis]|uniref:chemotaxis protein CheW n=1 Tax=Devosia beringensis TaxID=2657486 RepID=UPI00186BA7E8|nr:chemotaxis protein CheW [Devosia beringensis]
MASVSFHDGRMTAEVPVEVRTLDQFVTFTCSDRAFGIDIMSVREIRSWSPTTALPDQPHGAKGVLDIRGSVVQVYDLAVMLGGYGSEINTGQVVLVVSLQNQDVGLLVDTVSDIIFAQPEDLRPVPLSGGDRANAMVSGMFKNEDRLIAILNLAAMFPSYPGN